MGAGGGTGRAQRQTRRGSANNHSLAYNTSFEPTARPLVSRRLNSVVGHQKSVGVSSLLEHLVVATLHLMVGLPCSGKSTLARTLEHEHSALRLTPDEWQIRLFGQDAEAP